VAPAGRLPDTIGYTAPADGTDAAPHGAGAGFGSARTTRAVRVEGLQPHSTEALAVTWNTVRLVCAFALFTLCLWASPTVAHAGDQWCEDDPLVVIKTPQGALVPLYVTNGARGLEHLPSVTLASVTYSVKASGHGTTVDLAVTVPGGLLDPTFETRSTVSTGPFKTGAIFATASGYSREPMRMQFKLDVP
jgi:hypothetical protein